MQTKINELVIFYDGCHKIYYANENEKEIIKEMESYGYKTIKPNNFSKKLRELWELSCELRLISSADLDDKKPHLRQFDNNINRFLKELQNA